MTRPEVLVEVVIIMVMTRRMRVKRQEKVVVEVIYLPHRQSLRAFPHPQTTATAATLIFSPQIWRQTLALLSSAVAITKSAQPYEPLRLHVIIRCDGRHPHPQLHPRLGLAQVEVGVAVTVVDRWVLVRTITTTITLLIIITIRRAQLGLLGLLLLTQWQPARRHLRLTTNVRLAHLRPRPILVLSKQF